MKAKYWIEAVPFHLDVQKCSSQVRVYTPKRLFYQLEAAKEEFIRAMAGVWKEQKLLLPKLMEAYAKDVRLSPQGLVDMVQRHPTSFYSLTDWEGGYFPLTLHFSEDYPSKPPKCKFPHGFFHPNVYPSGTVYLSILNEGSGWRPAITVKQILVGIQDLLDQPIPADPSQTDGYHLFILDPTEYKRRVRLQAKQYPALV